MPVCHVFPRVAIAAHRRLGRALINAAEATPRRPCVAGTTPSQATCRQRSFLAGCRTTRTSSIRRRCLPSPSWRPIPRTPSAPRSRTSRVTSARVFKVILRADLWLPNSYRHHNIRTPAVAVASKTGTLSVVRETYDESKPYCPNPPHSTPVR